MKSVLILVFGLLLMSGIFSACNFQSSKEKVFQNPVLPGDNPNPSVIKIGESYYASATSNEWSPLFPIYKSDDLQHWELISYVFPGGAHV